MLVLRHGRAHDPRPDEDFDVPLRAEGNPDVRVRVHAGRAGLELTDHYIDGPHVDLDPPARTLVMWGRRPDTRGRFRSHVTEPTLSRLQALLSGY